jgi:flagellar hook-associated protein 2
VTSSVDGLVSGLSTSSLINQLMSVESAPQTALKTKVKTVQTAVASYQSVNSKLSALESAGYTLGQLSSWRGVKATSSSPAVTATATTSVTSGGGSLTVDVKALARAQQMTLKVTTHVDGDADGKPDAAKAPIIPDSQDKISITVGSDNPVDIAITDRSAEGIAAAINKAGLGVKAYVAKISDTEGVLQLTGAKAGAANSFSITGLESSGSTGGGPITTMPASDALIQVGDPDNGGFSVTNTSNTFTDLMSGVTLTATKVEDGVTISSEPDITGLADKFEALVAAANATLSEITKQTAYDASTKKGSPLTGDFMVRQISSTILSKVSAGLTDFGSLSGLGIQLTRDGQLSFNRDKFTSEYVADPTKIQKAGIAFAQAVDTMASNQQKTVKAVITGRSNEINSINDQIDNWDVRLTARREALQRQYASLETALGKLKDQGSWLSGQLAGLS